MPAAAGTFDVKGPEVTKGETEISINAAFFNGYPINADLLRHSWEVGASRGFTDWWAAGLKLALDQPLGAPFQASTAGVESVFVLRKFDQGFGISWYTSIDWGIHRDETNTLTFGPIVKFGTDKTALVAESVLCSNVRPQPRGGHRLRLCVAAQARGAGGLRRRCRRLRQHSGYRQQSRPRLSRSTG